MKILKITGPKMDHGGTLLDFVQPLLDGGIQSTVLFHADDKADVHKQWL